LTEIDVRATLKKKMNVDFDNYISRIGQWYSFREKVTGFSD